VPSDIPLDLAQAGKLYHDGDFEGAMVIYSAAALRGDREQRQQALWSLGRVQYSRGDNRGAEGVLKAFLDLQPAAEAEARAYLLLGAAQSAQGKTADARASLLRYVEMGGPAAPYAHLRLAELDSAGGDPGGAIKEVETALAQGPLPAAVETGARFARARYRDAAGDTAGAVADSEQLASDAAADSDKAEAVWQLASLSRRVGDAQQYQAALYSLATQYPWHARALESLDQPQLAPLPVLSNAQRGLVLFDHRLNDQATEAYRASLAEDSSPEAQAVGHYHLGVLAERAGDPDTALAEYEAARAVLAADPSQPMFAQASWDRALLLEAQGRLDEAAGAYATLADAASAAEQAPEALFRAGLIRFRQGRMEDASFLWRRYLGAAGAPEEEARAHFWLARAAEAAGDEPSAARELGLAVSLAPLDYYGLRARVLLDGDSSSGESRDTIRRPAPDWDQVERWLQSWAGPEDSPPGSALTDSAAWRRSLELERAGLEEEAGKEFAQLLDDATGRPWRLYRLARALAEEGQVPEAARAASRLVAGRAGASRGLLALAYPGEYLDLAGEATDQNGFSPLLLLSLVRQESFFDAGAVSAAGALGLTQVIPSTAQEIAGQLGETAFRSSDLLRPRVSLRFGAHYLGSQLKGFGGDLAAALAAYNGGPGNAGRWLRQAGDDPDLFVETIDFSETRDYVELVLENYALYRYTYGQTGHPSLALP